MPLDESKSVDHYLRSAGVEPISTSQTTKELEEMGWREVLMTLMPFAFEEDFSADHVKFWDLGWSVLMRIRKQRDYFKLGLVPKGEADQEKYFREKECWIE